MKNVTFETLISLFQRNLITKTDLLGRLKAIKLTDEQAIKLFDLEIWGQTDAKAWFQL